MIDVGATLIAIGDPEAGERMWCCDSTKIVRHGRDLGVSLPPHFKSNEKKF